MTKKHMLISHCLDIVTSRYVSLQSKLRLWTTPDFRMSAFVLDFFVFIKVFVIEIGSDKM